MHPSIWLEQFTTPFRNDFMQFTYFTYFTYLVILGGILYYRKDWRGYWSVMTYSVVAYSIGYMIAMSFPIESPWFSMVGSWHNSELVGGPFTALINFIEHYGRVRGAAFPSEHVAGSFAALWGAWRHRRWLFWMMLPLVLCMCVSTIYGRYHYVADIFGGITTGTIGYFIGGWIMRKSEGRVGGNASVAANNLAHSVSESVGWARLNLNPAFWETIAGTGWADRRARRNWRYPSLSLRMKRGEKLPRFQNIFSWRRRFPNVPMLAMMKATRN